MSQMNNSMGNSADLDTVIIKFQAYKDILLHSTRFCNPEIKPEEWREVYGFLVGKIEQNRVIVYEAIPMVHGGATEVEFKEKHYIEAAEANEKVAEKGFFLVGWYHSHPGLEIFLSSIDIQNHIGYQSLNPKAIALVIDPSKISSTYSGFEIFQLDDPTNPNSSYHKLNWKISDLDDKFIGQMLIDLSKRATIQRPLIDEYGESASPSSTVSQNFSESISQISPQELKTAIELLEKALDLGEKGHFTKAIDLAISAGKEFEARGKIGLASDAFLQVGGFLYEFWTKITKIRTELFTHQREPSENDAQSMIQLAQALSTTVKQVPPEKIGLILEIRNLSGKMVKVEDDKIQIANILIEAAEVYASLMRYAIKDKNTEKQIKFAQAAANVLSTALIFIRTVKKQKNLLNQLIDINKIISDINFYQVRIQEIRAEEKEAAAEYIQAAKLYIGGAIKAIEAAESLNDSLLASHSFGTAEICYGKGYRCMGDHQKYIDRNPCLSASYYNLACIHFEKAQRKFPVHSLADIKNAEQFFQNCVTKMKKAEDDCKKLNRKPIDPSKLGPLESELVISEPEPLFYP
ncbi:MAG: Mov34/MPN/PAD-1 family protein [Candidatus Helarchaeota archaeon]